MSKDLKNFILCVHNTFNKLIKFKKEGYVPHIMKLVVCCRIEYGTITCISKICQLRKGY